MSTTEYLPESTEEANDDEPELEEVQPTVLTYQVALENSALDGYYAEASFRGPNDAIVSGPVAGGWGPGRWMPSKMVAYGWAMRKYGEDRVKWLPRSTRGRWAFLIKNLKGGANAP